MGGGIGVGHRVTDPIRARGSGGSGLPLLDLANAASARARVFIHDPTNQGFDNKSNRCIAKTTAIYTAPYHYSLLIGSMYKVNCDPSKLSMGCSN